MYVTVYRVGYHDSVEIFLSLTRHITSYLFLKDNPKQPSIRVAITKYHQTGIL